MDSDRKFNIKLILLLVGMFILVLFIWNTPVVYPIKLFVVLLHELSHGLAALITGGKIVRIDINANQGGVCYTAGGWQFLILSAGYLGSMLWGGLILILASRTRYDKFISAVIGIIVVVIALLYIRTPFGLIYGIVFGVALFLTGFFAPMEVNDFILKLIGLTSILYVIIDIKDDLITRTVKDSDAFKMAQSYFGVPVFWGVLWIIIALIALFIIMKTAVKRNREYYN